MAKTFYLQIATPEKDFFSAPVEAITLTTTDGEVGVLPGHSATAVALAAAPTRIKTAEGWRNAALIGGFASIRPDYVIVFADTAEWPEDIEEARAMQAKQRAEERLQASRSKVEYVRSRAALERALTRLIVKQGKSQ